MFVTQETLMIIEPQLQAVFQAVFGPEVPPLTAQDSPATIERWDSLNHVVLMLALESEFGVQFDSNEIANLISVDAIQRRLSRR